MGKVRDNESDFFRSTVEYSIECECGETSFSKGGYESPKNAKYALKLLKLVFPEGRNFRVLKHERTERVSVVKRLPNGPKVSGVGQDLIRDGCLHYSLTDTQSSSKCVDMLAAKGIMP